MNAIEILTAAAPYLTAVATGAIGTGVGAWLTSRGKATETRETSAGKVRELTANHEGSALQITATVTAAVVETLSKQLHAIQEQQRADREAHSSELKACHDRHDDCEQRVSRLEERVITLAQNSDEWAEAAMSTQAENDRLRQTMRRHGVPTPPAFPRVPGEQRPKQLESTVAPAVSDKPKEE